MKHVKVALPIILVVTRLSDFRQLTLQRLCLFVILDATGSSELASFEAFDLLKIADHLSQL